MSKGLILEQLGSVSDCGCGDCGCNENKKNMRFVRRIFKKKSKPKRPTPAKRVKLSFTRKPKPANRRLPVRSTPKKAVIRPVRASKPSPMHPVVRPTTRPAVPSKASAVTNSKYPATKDLNKAKEIVKRLVKDRYKMNASVAFVGYEAKTWVLKGNGAYQHFINKWDKKYLSKKKAAAKQKPKLKAVKPRTWAIRKAVVKPKIKNATPPATKLVTKGNFKTVIRKAATRGVVMPVVKPTKSLPKPKIKEHAPAPANEVEMTAAESQDFQEAVKDRDTKKSAAGIWAAVLPAAIGVAIKKLF
jgi:hypothetical protein